MRKQLIAGLLGLALATMAIGQTSIAFAQGTIGTGRVWQTGLEPDQQTQTTSEWDKTGGMVMDHDVVRSGLVAARFDTPVPARSSLFSVSGSRPRTVWARLFVRVSGAPSQAVVFARLQQLLFVNVVTARLNTDLTVTLLNDVTGHVVGTSAVSLIPNQWNPVELYCLTDQRNGEIGLRIAGVDQFTVTDERTGREPILQMEFGPASSLGGLSWYFDDLAVNTNVGSVNNSWPGDGHIVLIRPDANVGPNEWVGLPGFDNYDLVNDYPGLATFNSYLSDSSGILGHEDRWSLSDLPLEVGDSATIKAVQFGVRGGGNNVAGTRLATLRASDVAGQHKDGLNTDWNVFNGFNSVYAILMLEQTLDPMPLALTRDYVNGLSAAARRADSNTLEIRWTVVWASVEYLQ